MKAAAALDIALTTRGTHRGEPIPMCGVPVHAADGYLEADPHRLQGRGLRADGRPGRSQEARLQVGGAARRGAGGDARHPDRGRAARRAQPQLPVRARRRRAERSASPGSISRPASSACQAIERKALARRAGAPRPDRDPAARSPAAAERPLRAVPGLEVRAVAAARTRASTARMRALRLQNFHKVAALDAFGAFTRAELAAAGAHPRLCRADPAGQDAAPVAARAHRRRRDPGDRRRHPPQPGTERAP